MSVGVCHFVIVQNNNIITAVFATGSREGFPSTTMMHVLIMGLLLGWFALCYTEISKTSLSRVEGWVDWEL